MNNQEKATKMFYEGPQQRVVYATREIAQEEGVKKMAYVFSSSKDFSDGIRTCKDVSKLGIDVSLGQIVKLTIQIENVRLCPHCAKPI